MIEKSAMLITLEFDPSVKYYTLDQYFSIEMAVSVGASQTATTRKGQFTD